MILPQPLATWVMRSSSSAVSFRVLMMRSSLKLGPGDETNFPTAIVGLALCSAKGVLHSERYVVGQHASERLEERGIMEWQVGAGLEDGELIVERPDGSADPAR